MQYKFLKIFIFILNENVCNSRKDDGILRWIWISGFEHHLFPYPEIVPLSALIACNAMS